MLAVCQGPRSNQDRDGLCHVLFQNHSLSGDTCVWMWKTSCTSWERSRQTRKGTERKYRPGWAYPSDEATRWEDDGKAIGKTTTRCLINRRPKERMMLRRSSSTKVQEVWWLLEGQEGKEGARSTRRKSNNTSDHSIYWIPTIQWRCVSGSTYLMFFLVWKSNNGLVVAKGTKMLWCCARVLVGEESRASGKTRACHLQIQKKRPRHVSGRR